MALTISGPKPPPVIAPTIAAERVLDSKDYKSWLSITGMTSGITPKRSR